MNIIGLARVVDFSEDSKTCRVRLCNALGLPSGEVLENVKLAADFSLPPSSSAILCRLLSAASREFCKTGLPKPVGRHPAR